MTAKQFAAAMATLAAGSGEEVAQASDFVARLLQEAENRFGMHAHYSPFYLVGKCIEVGHVRENENPLIVHFAHQFLV